MIQTTPTTVPRFVDSYPELGREPVSVEPYVSPEYFEKEREKIFKRHWLNVLREEDVPRPGDYFVKDIPVLNTSLLLVRGNDGKIRAFHNICRHRGNKLVYKEGAGHGGNFSCRFHGWAYGRAGQLINVPAEEYYYGIDKDCQSLVSLACETWEGFVFIHCNPKPTIGLREFLSDLVGQYAGYPFSQMQCISRFAATVKANWKVAADAFQEALHVPYIHGITLGDAFTSKENPNCLLTWARLYAFHRSASCYGNPAKDRQLFPTERVAFPQMALFAKGADQSAANLPGVNPGGVANWAFDINVIFPHLFLDPGNGQYFTMHFWPIDVHTTRWEFRLYMFPTDNAAQKVAQKYNAVLMRDGGLEDLSTVEATQKMLESGAIDVLPLSDQEILIRHHLAVVDKVVRAA